RLDIFQEPLAHQDDSVVTCAKVFARADGDFALTDPSNEILVHEVARHPATCFPIEHRSAPSGNTLLNIRLAALRDAAKTPGDAERILVIDRNAPLEMVARKEGIRPEADAADLPKRIFFTHALANAPVDDAIVEFVEREPKVTRRIWATLVREPHAPVHVHPFEMQRIH